MLTTISNIKALRDIAANVKDARLEPYIQEVEDAYIMPALGAELYERLSTQAEPTADDTILLDGNYYDGPKGREYCHGIRKATAYFAYSRMLNNQQVNVTAFGIVTKTGSYSQPAEAALIEKASIDAIKMGELCLASCIKFLHRNDECCKGHPGTRPGETKLHVQILS